MYSSKLIGVLIVWQGNYKKRFCTYLQGEATPLWDERTAKAHVVAVYEGACVAMGVHNGKVHCVTGGEWLPSLVRREAPVCVCLL